MTDGPTHVSVDINQNVDDCCGCRAELDRANALLDAVADDIGGDYLDLLAQEIEERSA